MRSFLTLIFVSSLMAGTVLGQGRDSSLFAYPIQLDEVVIRARSSGWDLDAFMDRVRQDTSFFKAFKTMRLHPHLAEHHFLVLDEQGNAQARFHARTRQHRKEGCRTMEWLHREVEGDFFKSNGNYRYYTASLYAYLFYTEGKVCGEDDLVAESMEERGRGRVERHKYQLKQLLFNPGSRSASLPFVGDRTRLFDPPLAEYYDFSLQADSSGGRPALVFSARVKPGREDKVVYQELVTWFDRGDYSILKRDYHIRYETLVYDFNVRIKVDMTRWRGITLPASLHYEGNWHLFPRKRERVRFQAQIRYD